MDPLTIGLGVGVGALAAYLARRVMKSRGGDAGTRADPAGGKRGLGWPADLPRVRLRDFLYKWLGHFASSLIPSALVHRKDEEPQDDEPSTSLQIKLLLNRLEPFLFWSGVLLLAWLVIEAVAWMTPLKAWLVEHQEPREMALSILAPAVVGYWTNWLALKMLFHPRRRNLVWQGLIPARRAEIVEGISDGVLTNLVSPEIVREYLKESELLHNLAARATMSTRDVVNNPEFRTELQGLVYGFVFDLVHSKSMRRKVGRIIQEKIDAWTGTTVGEKVIGWLKSVWGPKLKDLLLNALDDLPDAVSGLLGHTDRTLERLPEIVEEEAANIEEVVTNAIIEGLRSLDLKRIIHRQLGKMDEAKLESLLTGTVSSELKFIQTSGGIFGALVGLAIQFPVVRITLFAVAVGVALAYRFSVERPPVTPSTPSEESSAPGDPGAVT